MHTGLLMLGHWLLLRTECFFAVGFSDSPKFRSHNSLDISRTGADVPINISGVASTSRGLVGDTIFAVLPNIKPIHTFIITLAFQSVS
jgi:hypothetical protein